MSFDDVVHLHVDWIARLAFKFCRVKEDAEDLAQDTLFRIYANKDKFNGDRDFKPWAYTIMANIAKTRQARKELIGMIALCSVSEPASVVRADHLALYYDIIAAVKRVAKATKGIRCVMLFAAGYSYEEIARLVGVSVGTVKSRIAAGRAAIRKALGWPNVRKR